MIVLPEHVVDDIVQIIRKCLIVLVRLDCLPAVPDCLPALVPGVLLCDLPCFPSGVLRLLRRRLREGFVLEMK